MTLRQETGRQDRLAFALALALTWTACAAFSEPGDEWLHGRDLGPLEATTAALLLSGQSGGELTGGALWSLLPPEGPGERPALALVVDVDGGGLLAERPAERLALGVYAYAVAPDGSVAASLSQGLVITDEPTLDELEVGGLRFFGRLHVEPGAYSLRVLVREAGSGKLLLRTLAVNLPAVGERDPWVLPPLVLESSSRWLLANQEGLDPIAALALSDGELSPSARPVLESGRATGLMLVTSGLEASRFGVRVFDGLGRLVAEPRLEVEEPWPAEPNAASFVRARLAALHLAAGVYGLAVSAGEGADAPTGVVTVTVRKEQRSPMRAQLEPGADASAAVDPAEQVATYQGALRMLARGEEAAAVDAVANLEREVATAAGMPGLVALREMEESTVRRLTDAASSCLVPAVMLHHRLARQYLEEGDGVLTDHAIEVATRLAGWGERGRDRRFTVDVLTSLASVVLEAAWVGTATELLEHARELTPDDPTILLGLGAILERTGSYREAMRVLQRLVEVAPSSAEGRLRLAVNTLRVKGLRRCQSLLEELAFSAPEWTASVAAQELGRAMLQSGELEAADRFLEQAVERHSDSGRLLILRAAVLDRRGRYASAGELLDRLQPQPEVTRALPRVQYTFWPPVCRPGVVAQLEEEARARLPDLERALAATLAPATAPS